ncbi:MAG: hypothetical protein QXJ69_05650 [Desulfurococcaceae archaeon]
MRRYRREKILVELKRVGGETGVIVLTGHPRTYFMDPNIIEDPDNTLELKCINDFYVIKPSLRRFYQV